MVATKSHSYRGFSINPVAYAEKAAQGYRWYIQSVHGATGINYDSGECTHAYTLAQAKLYIDNEIVDQANIERM